MRLLIFLPSTERGGCEQYALALVRAMRQRAHDVTVCLPSLSETQSLIGDLCIAGSRIVSWRCGRDAAPAWPTLDTQWREAIALLRQGGFDKVLLALPSPDSALGMLAACCRLRQPSLAIFQLCSDPFDVPEAVKRLCRVATGRWLHPFSVSDASRHELANGLGLPVQSVGILHNTVGFAPTTITHGCTETLRTKIGVSASCALVLTVARITRQKGYRTLVRAAKALLDSGVDAHFVWIGAGKGEANFLWEIDKAGLQRAFLLAGWRADIGDWLRAADLFVLPSLWEGSPLALAEAMAHERRIVATAVGGVPEMLNAQSGWLVQPDDSAALAESMAKALADNSGARPRCALLRWRELHHLHQSRLFSLIENV